MGTPLFTLLCLSGEPGIVECSYCALTRVLDADEVSAAFGEAATIEDIEGLACPRCSIKNDARTRWTRAKVATPDDLFRAAHPGRGGGARPWSSAEEAFVEPLGGLIENGPAKLEVSRAGP